MSKREFVKSELQKPGLYRVTTEQDTYIGEFICKEDGYYDYWPDLSRGGYWPAWFLREIANKLDEINKPWDDELMSAFAEFTPND